MSNGTTQWVSDETAKILDALSDYHETPKSKLINYLVYSFALSSPEMREMLLDLGLTVQTHFDMGMEYEFTDTLLMPDEFSELWNNEKDT